MYLKSGIDYYIVVLQEVDIVCTSGLIIRSPTIKFKLLSYPDLNKIGMMTASRMKDSDINEEVCNKCIIHIVGFEEEIIDFDESPAGIVDHIGSKIRENSVSVIDDLETTFEQMVRLASMFERISLVVAHYTNNTYEYCQGLPVDELMKRYAICSLAFPAQVPPIVFEKEEESKVG